MSELQIDDEGTFMFKSSVLPDWTDPSFFSINGTDHAWDLTPLYVGEFAIGADRQDKAQIRVFISEGKSRDTYFEWWRGIHSQTD